MDNEEIELDAGGVGCSKLRYRITFPHDHKTLKKGDVVIMIESPDRYNILLRESDFTTHVLTDEHGQYVHLIELPNAQAQR